MKQITTNNEKTMRHTEKMKNNETNDRSYKKNVYFWNIEWDLNELNVFSGKLRCCKKNTDRVISLYLVVFFNHRANFLISGFSNKKHLNMHSNQTQTLKKNLLDG